MLIKSVSLLNIVPQINYYQYCDHFVHSLESSNAREANEAGKSSEAGKAGEASEATEARSGELEDLCRIGSGNVKLINTFWKLEHHLKHSEPYLMRNPTSASKYLFQHIFHSVCFTI